MIEIVEKIEVNSKIRTTVPGKKYSRYPMESLVLPGPRRNDEPTPEPRSNQKISGEPSAPTIRLRCRRKRTISRRHKETEASRKSLIDPPRIDGRYGQ